MHCHTFRPARRAGSLLLGAALFAGLLCLPSRAVWSTVSPPEPNSALITPGQVTLDDGECATFHLKVRFKGGNTYVDETESSNTSFSAYPTNLGSFTSKNVYCARNDDDNLPPSTVTIYGSYRDPKTGVIVSATANLKLSTDDEVSP